MVEAICKELYLRRNFLQQDEIKTIYFGGGTPSLLEESDFDQIFEQIRSNYPLASSVEITVECNPDDLDRAKLEDLKAAGVNRLSIGVQSFDGKVLSFMNRAHNEQEAKNAIVLAKEVGFDNITIDLIYGIPDTPSAYWQGQIEQLLALEVQHISAYCLTIENNTLFGHLRTKGKMKLPEDEISLEQFNYLVDRLQDNGFEQYEISNFAQEGYISQHNSAYWLNDKYLGIGPSAHSYNRKERGWNIRNNHQYIKSLNEGFISYESEELTDKDKFNDYILTRLRTKWGIEKHTINEMLKNCPPNSFVSQLQKHLTNKNLIEHESIICLTKQGKFVADKIAADLFV